ncbi:MAG: hypothetical protein CR994_09250 [Maribacter sp.]|nr:MAG: hypothetical protein CR994_09250 [Maribacter sp.]
MGTLENHTLLYDKDCPLCKVYTSGFIKTDMLDANGRKPFCNIPGQENYIDLKRATNGIALADTKNKTVVYGMDSSLKVIGNSFPIVGKTGNLRPIKFLLGKTCSFISYNRKVIMPGRQSGEKAFDCVPGFNYGYSLAYIVLAGFITTIVLFVFSGLLHGLPESTIQGESILALGQILFQVLFLMGKTRRAIIGYIGNLMTVSLMGPLLLIPVVLLGLLIDVHQGVILGWLGLTVSIMFIGHSRRVKALGLPSYLSYTWMVYRVVALIIILNV